MIKSKEKKFISVIFYIHNSSEKLRLFLPYIMSELSNNFEKFEIIAVNDKSTDYSVEVIRDFIEKSKNHSMVTIINMSLYQGMEASMNAGMDLAIGDFVLEFDRIDLDYEKDMFMNVYQKAMEGYDIVSAAPKNTSGLSSKTFYSIYNWGAKGKSQLTQETFRILSRRAINRVKALNKTIPYRKALYQDCGLNIYTIRYDNSLTKYSYEKNEITNRFDMAIDSLILFTNTVQKISLLISTFFFLFTILVGVYTVVVYLGANKPVEGWAPIMGVLSIGFCGIFLLITVILKYLSIILNMLYKRQEYLIESIEKIS